MIMHFNMEDKPPEFLRVANSSVAKTFVFSPALAAFPLRVKEINDVLSGIF